MSSESVPVSYSVTIDLFCLMLLFYWDERTLIKTHTIATSSNIFDLKSWAFQKNCSVKSWEHEPTVIMSYRLAFVYKLKK